MAFSKIQIYIIAAIMAIAGYIQYINPFSSTIGLILLIVSVLLVIFAGSISQPSLSTPNAPQYGEKELDEMVKTNQANWEREEQKKRERIQRKDK